MPARDNVLLGITAASAYLKQQGIYIPNRGEIAASIKATWEYLSSHEEDVLKTKLMYSRVLRRNVLDFYRGDMEVGEFIDNMVDVIQGQFTRAWREGARGVGFDLSKITDADMQPLLNRVNQELDQVLNFAQSIVDTAQNGDPVGPLLDRTDLWANRYDEIENEAEIYFGTQTGANLIWELGATEQHCTTCAALNGIVAPAEEWQASGLHPQGAPNDMLECGGWRCDCHLYETDEPPTEGGIPNA